MTKGNCSLKIIKLTQQAQAHTTPPRERLSSMWQDPWGTILWSGGSRWPTVALKPETDINAPSCHRTTAGWDPEKG